MSAKHTPGPWSLRRSLDSSCKFVHITSPSFDRIAVCTKEEDAALCCAAPEMLEALEMLVSTAGPSVDDIAVARAAIAKAKGGAA